MSESQPIESEGAVMTERPRIGILVVAYNAASTLGAVLDRIPEDFKPRIDEIFVCDDFSQDATYLVGLGYKQISDLPIRVIRNPRNLGYGGNQKSGYRMAIEHDLDIIVMLHGDGQYAPECLESLVEPLVDGRADAVFGSRMLIAGAARKGGMPLYKYAGNKILTKFQNWMAGSSLSEFHSGYRAYSVRALESIDFESNSDDFNFDTQIILQLLERSKRIHEVPIDTYYGDEICYVNGLSYAKDVTADVIRFRIGRLGFGGSAGDAPEEYELKPSPSSSHGRILAWLERLPTSRVLDLGCGSGALSEIVRSRGHDVTGIELAEVDGARSRMERLIVADLDDGIPDDVGHGFDVAIAGDVLEHLRAPEHILDGLHTVLRPGGSLILSVPNFAHWYPRVRVAVGRFDYDRRGILDRGHVRFFTRRSLLRALEQTGWSITRMSYVGLPFDVLTDGTESFVARCARAIDRLSVKVWPTLFAYQFVIECHASPTATATATATNSTDP